MRPDRDSLPLLADGYAEQAPARKYSECLRARRLPTAAPRSPLVAAARGQGAGCPPSAQNPTAPDLLRWGLFDSYATPPDTLIGAVGLAPRPKVCSISPIVPSGRMSPTFLEEMSIS